METIEFVYTFKNLNGNDVKEVRTVIKNEDGLHCNEICEMFEEFMRSCGFSEENVWNYFKY